MAALRRAIEEGLGNPSSSHFVGRRAQAVVANSREAVASRDATLTDSCSRVVRQAANRVLERATRPRSTFRLVVSSIEHAAVLAPAELLVVLEDERSR